MADANLTPDETVLPPTTGHLRLLRINGIGAGAGGYRVFAGSQEVALASKEFALLRTLTENAGRAMSRRQLPGAVWGTDYPEENKTLEGHIHRRRKKFTTGGRTPPIRTVPGFGYIFDVGAA